MSSKAGEIIRDAMQKAQEKEVVQELMVFMTNLSRLETMELFGVATLLKVPLNKGVATVDVSDLKHLEDAGLGKEFSFLMEKNDLKQMDQLLTEIFDAFILETPERQRNLCAIVVEAREENK